MINDIRVKVDFLVIFVCSCLLVPSVHFPELSKTVASTTVNSALSVRSVDGNLPLHPHKKVIDTAIRALIDRLLLKHISLAGIARATQVSEQWLQTYIKEKYTGVSRQVQVTPKKRGG